MGSRIRRTGLQSHGATLGREHEWSGRSRPPRGVRSAFCHSHVAGEGLNAVGARVGDELARLDPHAAGLVAWALLRLSGVVTAWGSDAWVRSGLVLSDRVVSRCLTGHDDGGADQPEREEHVVDQPSWGDAGVPEGPQHSAGDGGDGEPPR